MNTKMQTQTPSHTLLTLAGSLALIALLASGCASTSGQRAHNTQELKKVVEGQTTKPEVKQLLGEPNGVSRNGDGAELWVYSWNNIRQKITGRGYAFLVPHVVGSFVPGATMVASAGSVALDSAPAPSTTAQTTTIAFNSEGVVTTVSYNEVSQK